MPAYEQLDFGEVYPGIHLLLRAASDNVEKLFLIDPKADPDVISLQLSQAKNVAVNDRGELEVYTDQDVVRFSRPVAYQEFNGNRRSVDVTYAARGTKYGFRLGAYDRDRPLVIDPVLNAVNVGGSQAAGVSALRIDKDGNVYAAGTTYSSDLTTFPGPYNADGYDTTFNGGYARSDGFIIKLDADLGAAQVATYLGGYNYDYITDLELDADGNVYVSGRTYSYDFPTTENAFDQTCGMGDAGACNTKTDGFVSKLDANLTALLGSTFVGGTSGDVASGLALDKSNNVYVTGATGSSDFPVTEGAYDTVFNSGKLYKRFRLRKYSSAGFVSLFNSDLTEMIASSFIEGAAGFDTGYDVATIGGGDVYVVGWTGSPDFPVTAGAYDESYNGIGSNWTYPYLEVFLTRLDGSLSSLVASTFLGGSGREHAYGMRLDGSGNVYVSG